MIPSTSPLLFCGIDEEVWHPLLPSIRLPFDAANQTHPAHPHGQTSNVIFDIVVLKVLSHPWEEKERGPSGVVLKFALAHSRKEQGNRLLKKGFPRLAMDKYQAAQCLIEYEETDNPEEFLEEASLEVLKISKEWMDKIALLKVTLFLNLAVCYQREGGGAALKQALSACNQALEIRPKHCKGLFRRGCLHIDSGELDLAMVDFKAFASIDPSNLHVAHKIRHVQNLRVQAGRRYRSFEVAMSHV